VKKDIERDLLIFSIFPLLAAQIILGPGREILHFLPKICKVEAISPSRLIYL
jgi:hypothetical protein